MFGWDGFFTVGFLFHISILKQSMLTPDLRDILKHEDACQEIPLVLHTHNALQHPSIIATAYDARYHGCILE